MKPARHDELRQRPIGIFDSGLGGLTVARAIRRALPHEDLVYLGDTARVPYGSKGPETVAVFSGECLDWLRRRGVKTMVAACNTASAVALPSLMNDYEEPLVGVIEPGVRAAAKAVRRGPVGVIGTRATIASMAYRQRFSALKPGIELIEQACPLLVPLVEEGWVHHPILREVIVEYLGPMRARCVEVVILGCTHYPLLKDALGRFFGEDTVLVDSAEETAREVGRLLKARGLETTRDGPGQCSFYATDDPSRLVELGGRIFWEDVDAAFLANVAKTGALEGGESKGDHR